MAEATEEEPRRIEPPEIDPSLSADEMVAALSNPAEDEAPAEEEKAEKTEMFIVEEETVEFLDFADEETEVNLDGEE